MIWKMNFEETAYFYGNDPNFFREIFRGANVLEAQRDFLEIAVGSKFQDDRAVGQKV